MPGGHLSHYIYRQLGGERDFGPFWLQLGLPTLVILAVSYLLLVHASERVSPRSWLTCATLFVSLLAAGVGVRVIE